MMVVTSCILDQWIENVGGVVKQLQRIIRLYIFQKRPFLHSVVRKKFLLDPLLPVKELQKFVLDKATRRNYLDNIRELNNSFAIMSLGVNIEMPSGRGPYVFRIHGQIYNQIGTLLPPDNMEMKYASLYLVEPNLALAERMKHPANKKIDCNLLKEIQEFLYRVSPYAKSFKHMYEVEQKEKRYLKLI